MEETIEPSLSSHQASQRLWQHLVKKHPDLLFRAMRDFDNNDIVSTDTVSLYCCCEALHFACSRVTPHCCFPHIARLALLQLISTRATSLVQLHVGVMDKQSTHGSSSQKTCKTLGAALYATSKPVRDYYHSNTLNKLSPATWMMDNDSDQEEDNGATHNGNHVVDWRTRVKHAVSANNNN
jgi:VEFS-Box of polycomb protein